jgi:hypothetical protein
VSGVLRGLCNADPQQQQRLRALETGRLAEILARTTADAEAAGIGERDYLAALGIDGAARSAGDAWRALALRHVAGDPGAAEHAPALEVLLGEGCLARRILRRVGREPTRDALGRVYRELADCLREGILFRADR